MPVGETSTLDRSVLEYLANRPYSALTASTCAEWVHHSVPSVVAALHRLNDAGLVRYYPSHRSKTAGTWTVSEAGLVETNHFNYLPDRKAVT